MGQSWFELYSKLQALGVSKDQSRRNRMRYFFNVQVSDGIIQDDEGKELASLEQIKQEATIIAHELASEFEPSKTDVGLQSIQVTDEIGEHCLSLPIYN
jgi:hypothetical protein